MSLLVFLVVSLLLLITAVRPKFYIFAVFLIGPLPFGALLRFPFVATPIGVIHINALLVFSILLSALVGVALHVSGVRRHLGSVWIYLAFLVFAVVSIAWTPDVSIAVRMLLKLITPVVFLMYVALTVDKVGVRNIWRAVMTSGIVYGLASLASWGLGLKAEGGFGLPATSAAVTSGHLLAPFGLAVSEALTSGGMTRWAGALLAGVAILAGFTRITIGGMFAQAALAFFLRFKGPVRVMLPAAGVVAFVALFTLVDQFRSRMFLEKAGSITFESVLRDPGSTLSAIGGSGRYAAWDLALTNLFTPNPIGGAGVGATQLLFYDPTGVGASVVHSEVVRILCDLGVVGFVLFALGWLQILRKLNMRRREFAGHRFDAFPIGAMAAVAGYLVFLLTDNGLDYVAQIGVFTYGIVGAVIGARGEVPVSSTRSVARAVAEYASVHRPQERPVL